MLGVFMCHGYFHIEFLISIDMIGQTTVLLIRDPEGYLLGELALECLVEH